MVEIREHNFTKIKIQISKDPERAEWRKVKVTYKLKTQGRQPFLEVSF